MVSSVVVLAQTCPWSLQPLNTTNQCQIDQVGEGNGEGEGEGEQGETVDDVSAVSALAQCHFNTMVVSVLLQITVRSMIQEETGQRENQPGESQILSCLDGSTNTWLCTCFTILTSLCI